MNEKKKVSVTVNGHAMQLPEGTPLLQALIDEKIEVPHFCYHPGIGIEGSCRLCLVEIVGQPKLATSCTVMVKEGMDVKTNSAPVDKARKGVLEFFLINHPLDCPFCDKGGECPLQNYTLDSNQEESRFEFEKVHKEKHQSIGEHIVLDKERCVLCNRCVRFGRNLSGHEELSIQNRGNHSEIFVPEGTQLTTGFTGNLADICPVGALTTKEFRFQARPWELKTTDSLCGGCSVGCNVEYWKKDQKLLRMTPRIAPNVNEWWLCDKGRFSLSNFVQDSDRLTLPQKHGNTVGEQTWSQEFVQDVKQVSNLGVICDTTLSNEEFFTVKMLANALKAKVYTPVTKDLLKFRQTLKTKNILGEFPQDLEAAENIVVVGEKLEEDHPVLALRVRRLFHTFKKNVFSLGTNHSEFKDLYTKHIPSSIDKLSTDFASLNIEGSTAVFLSSKWVNSATIDTMTKFLEQLSGSTKVFLLLEGANAHGIMDQLDNTFSYEDLKKDIQFGKVDGLIQLGNSFQTDLSNLWYAQAVHGLAEIHEGASWALPFEYFTEKAGTYTNTFGQVQRLHRSRRVSPRAFDTIRMLESILHSLGQTTIQDIPQIYANMAKELDGYPKAITEIVEHGKTYMHYERAQWR